MDCIDHEVAKSRTRLNDSLSLLEGNGNPLQYSCLEDPMERGAWRATVHGSQGVGHSSVTNPFSSYKDTLYNMGNVANIL